MEENLLKNVAKFHASLQRIRLGRCGRKHEGRTDAAFADQCLLYVLSKLWLLPNLMLSL